MNHHLYHKRKWRQAFLAQEVLVIDGATSGWLKIISYEGEKWINPNGGIEMFFESTAYSVENSPPHERITAYGIDIGKNKYQVNCC